jgi:hypothetical protein
MFIYSTQNIFFKTNHSKHIRNYFSLYIVTIHLIKNISDKSFRPYWDVYFTSCNNFMYNDLKMDTEKQLSHYLCNRQVLVGW